jgi:hypothetical protein
VKSGLVRVHWVHVDRNRYSVDCRYDGKTVSLRTYADRIVSVADGNIVGEHVRSNAIAPSSILGTTLRRWRRNPEHCARARRSKTRRYCQR